MANKQTSRARIEVVRCPNCGEDYSVTYKRCPFCDERPDQKSGAGGGGKRLRNGKGGGGWGIGRIITAVLSVALIVAAVVIVVTIVKPLVDRGESSAIQSASPGATATATPDSSPSQQAEATPSPGSETTPTPAITASPTPAGQTATGFTLNQSDFTLDHAGATYQLSATFSPAGSTGAITWTSSKPAAVYVDQYGKVTALANGNSTITATLAGGSTQTCVVRCGWSGDTVYPTPSGSSGTSASSGTLALNRTDFSLTKKGETFTMRVTGASGTPTWSIKDSSVATISSDGVIKAVSSGTTTVTCKVDGQTLTCVVRCKF